MTGSRKARVADRFSTTWSSQFNGERAGARPFGGRERAEIKSRWEPHGINFVSKVGSPFRGDRTKGPKRGVPFGGTGSKDPKRVSLSGGHSIPFGGIQHASGGGSSANGPSGVCEIVAGVPGTIDQHTRGEGEVTRERGLEKEYLSTSLAHHAQDSDKTRRKSGRGTAPPFGGGSRVRGRVNASERPRHRPVGVGSRGVTGFLLVRDRATVRWGSSHEG